MQTETHHILIAEDTPAIQDDYRRILSAEDEWASSVPGAAKFAPELVDSTPPPCPLYELTCVAQGEEALSAAERATTNGKPFSLAFIDVRMPPGVDGVQTALELRRRHPDLQIVLCTAYSDYSWQDIIRNFPESDGVLLLKKPFDPAEVRQLAYNLAQKRRLSTENHQLINNLERLITARTMQLVQKSQELATALSAAQKADRAKHDFLRCVSHELNTPLNGVHGAASVLSFSTDRQAQAMGQIITDSSNRLKRLFTRILLYLDLEPVTTPTPSPLRTGTALAAAVESYQEAAKKKGLMVKVANWAPPIVNLSGKSQLFTTAAENLVENAIKFTDQGEIGVELLHDEARDRLILKVTDTGAGLSPSKLADLEALFAPGDMSITRRQDGLGIGLALVARIARHLGGEITARPLTPAGSEFTLILPCLSSSPDKPDC